ncbi:hypothetical protein KFZ76_06555 [Methylovulum psychrotolerans]|nr:hypothetical protein [Methylovulum psychrotolerans]MBT9097370.1 hypothetical protein [Methylovulum psychrotolerans]
MSQYAYPPARQIFKQPSMMDIQTVCRRTVVYPTVPSDPRRFVVNG